MDVGYVMALDEGQRVLVMKALVEACKGTHALKEPGSHRRRPSGQSATRISGPSLEAEALLMACEALVTTVPGINPATVANVPVAFGTSWARCWDDHRSDKMPARPPRYDRWADALAALAAMPEAA